MKRFAFALGLLGIVAASPAAAQSCMIANASEQIAEGRLVIKRAQDAAGRPENPYILELPVPACLDGATPDDRVKASGTIHVFSSNPVIHTQIGKLVGRYVLVRGNPFVAHTAHHHAPIVMDLSEIDAN